MKKIRFAVPVKERANAYLYIVFNPAMPGWIKFGQTTRLEQRLNQLSSSSPVPFVLLYKIKIRRDWALKIESAIKHEFKELWHINRAGIPKRSHKRSLEWIYYRGEEVQHCRTDMVNWIKRTIKHSLRMYHYELRR